MLRTCLVLTALLLANCQPSAPTVKGPQPTAPEAATAAPEPSTAPSSASSPLAPSPPPAPIEPSPFVIAHPHLDPRSVFELEDGLFAVAGDDLFELSAGAVRARFDLAVGLPSDDCQGITGLVGRFPDAAFALVSWSSRACGSVFGAHKILRWKGRAWAPVREPEPPVIKLAAQASLEHSQGPGVVICDFNSVGDGCHGTFALLPRVPRAAVSPVGRVVVTRLSEPMFRFAPSGLAVALGVLAEVEGAVAIERFSPGATKGLLTKLPISGCTPAGLFVQGDKDIVVAAACEGERKGRLMRFDGRAFSDVEGPTEAPFTALTGEGDGTLWAATKGDAGPRLHRRSPSGEWASVPFPRADDKDPSSERFSPSRLVVRGGDVWAIGAGVFYARRHEIE